MKNNEIIKDITDTLFSIQVKNEKLEGFNVLISDKLESIRYDKHEEIAMSLFSARRNIENYLLLSYSISDKMKEIEQDIQKIYNLLDSLKESENINETEVLVC